MKRMTPALLTLCAALVAFLATAGDAEKGDSPAASLLAKMPAKSAAERREVNAQLVALGPSAVAELCGKLVQPGTGDDTQARYALDGLSTYVHRPGAERERLMVAGSYVKALEYAGSGEVRAFLIRQLERVGREESLAALAEFLTDPRLGEPAARALVTIGTPGVSRRLLRALPLVEGTRKVTIINGLGTLRVEAATQELVPHTRSDDAEIRRAALAALANIGHVTSENVLRQAAQSEDERARVRGAQLYLRYARRLAEAGQKKACARICRELIAAWSSASHGRNIACVALSTLAGAVGDEAGDDLVEAMKTDQLDLCGVALALAPTISGEDYTARWVAMMAPTTPDARAGILAMLGRRGDRSALPAVRKALEDESPTVKFAAIQSTASLEKRPALTILIEATARAQGDQKGQFLLMLGRFGGQQALQAVAAGTRSDDAGVQAAAVRALTDWPEPNALGDLLRLFRESDDVERRRLVLGATMRLIAASGRSQDAVLELYKDALAVARTPDEKKIILGGLGRLKSRPSLELVQTFFYDEDLTEAATAAAVSIIKPRRSGRGGLRGRRVMATLEKVIAMTENEELRGDARAILKTLKESARKP